MAYIRPLARPASSRVLVVGGGIAGIQAALEAAAVGLPVSLVEEGPALGGLMARLDKTFPTNDCAMCILSPRMLAIARDPGVEVLSLTRVLEVRGRAGDFQVLLSRRPRYVVESKCSGCGECTRVCPQKIPDPYNLGFSQTKAVHLPFPQAVPQAVCLAPEACRFFQGKPCRACQEACPAGAIDFEQQPEEWVLPAGAIILAPGCRPAPAQGFRGWEHPDVVTSLEFERLLSPTGPYNGKLRRPSDLSEPSRLAFIQCVGSRDPQAGAAYCSGLCCLTSLKEAVVAKETGAGQVEATVFYMDLRAQGKGHESYLEQTRERGIRLIRSRVVGITPRDGGGVLVRYANGQGRPREAAFDLAVLSVGLRPAANLPRWARGLQVELGEHGFFRADPWTPACAGREGILVCGAGREPMDISDSVTSAGAAAGAAARLLTVSLRTPAPRLRLPEGQDGQPVRTGVFLCHCGTNIAKTLDLERLAQTARLLPGVVHVEDCLFACAVESTHRMAATIRDQKLNRVVVAACSPRTHEAVFREVVAAAGLNPGYFAMANLREQCAWVHTDEPGAAQEKAQRLLAMAVRRAAVLGPLAPQAFPVIPRALVLGGGVAGMSGALSLAQQGFHTYLLERSEHLGGLARNLYFTLEGPDPQEFLQELQSQVYRHPNIEVLLQTELVQVAGHVGQFRSTVRQQGLSDRQVRRLEHGVVLVATGGRAASPRGRYLCGEDPRVLTQAELEAMIHFADHDLEKVRRLVMIQCVGSREPEHPYCSRLCCSQALKNALLLKERYPRVEITVLYRDLRAYGFREIYYQKAKEKGVEFIPFEAECPPRLEAPRRRPLTVWVRDELLGQEVGLSADLVILSAGVRPAADREQVARRLSIPLTLDGFFQEAHQKLRPVDTVADGVFICGVAHYPKSLAESAAQAQAAAQRAAGLLFQTELWGSELVARISAGKCRRCLACRGVCPFGAVLVADGAPEIQGEICRGCGICAAECPVGAIEMSRAADDELTAQIEAALW